MNKFGRSLPSAQKRIKVMQVQIPTPNLITLTKDGDYTIQGHRLCDIGNPTDDTDAVNKGFVENVMIVQKNQINQLLEELQQKYKNSLNGIDSQFNKHDDVHRQQTDLLSNLDKRIDKIDKFITGISAQIIKIIEDLSNQETAIKELASLIKIINIPTSSKGLKL